LAERRYEEADPSNRLVASTLEKRCNDATQRVIKLAEVVRYPDNFVATKVRTMAEKYDDEEIVRWLNGEGLTSSTGKPFTVSIVRWIRFKHRIPGDGPRREPVRATVPDANHSTP
jgi:hypothetical protein